MEGERLAPHSRPRVVKAKHHALMTGQWQELFADLMPTDWTPPMDVPMGAATPPGLLTQQRSEHLRRSAAFGKPAKAWRQLWGWGAPPASMAVADALAEKLQLNETEVPEPAPKEKVASGVSLAAITEHHWRRVKQTFHPDKAADALGWSQEAFVLFLRASQTKSWMRALVHALLDSSIDPFLIPFLCLGRVVPLFKGRSGHLRPVTVSSMWRKCAGALTVGLFSGTDARLSSGLSICSRHG